MFTRHRLWIFALAALPACECNGVTFADGGFIGIDAQADGSMPDAAIDAPVDAAKGGSIACYIRDQFRCVEYPTPTSTQVTDVQAMCSSASGVPSQPAACPSADYRGKCTRPASEGYVERFYAGTDAAYDQDFCVNTAHGVWSTAF